jgi:hypothetical protein
MSEQSRDDERGRRADEREPSAGREDPDPLDALRRSTERVRRNGRGLADVHEQLQSTASRVQALRATARSLGEEIARTRDAVEQPARASTE